MRGTDPRAEGKGMSVIINVIVRGGVKLAKASLLGRIRSRREPWDCFQFQCLNFDFNFCFSVADQC